MALEAAELEHPARADLACRILEDAAERPLVRRLRRLPLRDQLRDRRPDVGGRTSLEPILDARHDLTGRERGVTVGEAELVGRQPLLPVGRDDERADEDVRPVAAVRTRVHDHASSGGPRDRARELEPAQPCIARPMEAHGIRRTAPGDEYRVDDLDRRELALQPEHERVDIGVPGQHVGAEPHDHDAETLVTGESQRLAKLGNRARDARALGQDRRRRSWSASRAGRHARSPSRRKPLDDRAGDPPRLAHTERHDHVSRTCPCERQRSRIVERRRPASPRRRRHVVQDELAGHTGERGVTAADHVRHDCGVGDTQRLVRAPGGADASARRRAAGRRQSARAARARAPSAAPP